MDKKFYISCKAARLLREKGYNEETEYTIDNNGRIWMGEYKDECDFPCPTKAEAIDWLESKGIVVVLGRVTPIYVGRAGEKEWSFDLELKESGKFNGCLRFKTRLEAEEAAIIQACELL